MGRLDDAAKRKVVELRKAGLSFRKIKAVLELENIKVSAQAIYLFLREFQGRRPGRVRPQEAGGGAANGAAHVNNLVGGLQESWRSIRLQHLLQDAARHAGVGKLAKRADGNAKGCGGSGAESPPEQRRPQCVDDNDVQIVSVTSLAQSQPRAEASATCSSPGTPSVAFARRRVTPSPATSSMLAARKRILDKALTHKMKVTSSLRREHANVQRSDLAAMSQQQPAASTHYDLTTEKTGPDDVGTHTSRRFVPQRSGLSVRSLHTLPRLGTRLPNRPAAPFAAALRTQTSEPSQEGGARGTLQDQIQTLGCEVRSLGLAVKMLVEQHSRLEREQAQQTHIQKQILSTLLSLAASAAGPCAQQAHNKTPSPSRLPATSSSFSQDAFDFTQVPFSQCGQSQAAYDSLESPEPAEAFKVPVLSPLNGFPPCSENLPLAHAAPPRTQQAYAYPQQNCPTLLAPYAQSSYAPAYERSHPQAFREAGSKTADFHTRNLQDVPTQEHHLNVIKVEGP